MTRVQILLPEEQDRRLERLAARTGQSKASLVRRAIDLLFRSESTEHEPLLDLVGQAGPSLRHDVSDEHDRVLAAAERTRNRRR
jgi:hypothetical protein